jgi:hypothetical protein
MAAVDGCRSFVESPRFWGTGPRAPATMTAKATGVPLSHPLAATTVRRISSTLEYPCGHHAQQGLN